MNNIGNKIKSLRKSLKLTQNDVSCDALSRSTLSKIETGSLIPSIPQLEYLAEKLNVPIEIFFHDETKIEYNKYSYNKKNLFKLYNNQKYFDIIEKIKPYDFLTYFYVGMSYFNIDIKKEADDYLKKCEPLFKNLNESEKICSVEKLCIALNTLRKIRIKEQNSEMNKKSLDKILYYLNLYDIHNCEIYYNIYNSISIYYIINCEYSNALNIIQDILNNNMQITSLTMLPYFHTNLGIIYFALKDYDKAIDSFKSSIFFFNYTKNKELADTCNINLFNCSLYKGDFEKCHEIIDNAIKNSTNPKVTERLKNLYLVLYYNMNEMTKLQNTIKLINTKRLSPNSKIDYYFILARINTINGNYKNVKTYYKKCIKYLSDKNRSIDLTYLYNDLYKATGSETYKIKYIQYDNLNKEQQFNPIDPDITSPHCRFGLDK